jgi:hypothetical protein
MAVKKNGCYDYFNVFSLFVIGGVLILSAPLALAGSTSQPKGVTFAEQIASVFEYEEEGSENDISEEYQSELLKRRQKEAVLDPEFQEIIRKKSHGPYAKNQRKIYAVRANIRLESEAAEVEFYIKTGSNELQSKELFHSIELGKANEAFCSASSALAKVHSVGTASQNEIDAANQDYLYCKEVKSFHREELSAVRIALISVGGQI